MQSDSAEKHLLRPLTGQRNVIPEPHITRKVRPIEYVVNENECWDVTSHRSSNGQGGPSVRRNGKRLLVSRYVYELINGPIDRNVLLVNTCGCQTCCNPAHYETRDKGYFNTYNYMLTQNPEHYDNLCKANRLSVRKRVPRGISNIEEFRRMLKEIDQGEE